MEKGGDFLFLLRTRGRGAAIMVMTTVLPKERVPEWLQYYMEMDGKLTDMGVLAIVVHDHLEMCLEDMQHDLPPVQGFYN
eukprot:g27659.t1